MAYPRPILSQIYKRIQTDISGGLQGIGVFLQYTAERAIGAALTGATHLLHGHLAWVGRQVIPTTADEEAALKHASIWGINRAGPGQGAITLRFSGVDGSPIPIGTKAQRANGAAYLTTVAGVIVDGEFVVACLAEKPGYSYAVEATDLLTLVGALNGIDGVASVLSVEVKATDEESVESVVAKLEDKVQSPGAGLGKYGYVAVAKDVVGVTRVWQQNLWSGAGTIRILFAMDNAETGGDPVDPIPDAPTVALVQSAVDDAKYPTANILVAAPSPVTLNMEISIDPDTPAMRAAVEDQVVDWLATVQPDKTKPASLPLDGTLEAPGLKNAISETPGLLGYTLTLPAADVAIALDELGTLGVTTWT